MARKQEKGKKIMMEIVATNVVARLVTNCNTDRFYLDASYPHWLAHLAMFPARQWPQVFLDDKDTEGLEGTRNYISFIKGFGR